MSDDNYGVLDYIPVIGDIYRYGKLGYKIGSWLAKYSDDDHNNRIICEMVEIINQAANSDDAFNAIGYLHTATEKLQEFDTDNCKKYQLALLYYLGARIYHVLALCECIIHRNELKELKQVSSTFSGAKKFCKKVWSVDKTLFTDNRSMIDQIRIASDEKKKEINESKRMWRKQYRHLYKITHPVRWYLGMWIFA